MLEERLLGKVSDLILAVYFITNVTSALDKTQC